MRLACAFLLLSLASSSSVLERKTTLRVRSFGAHHRAVLPGVTLRWANGWEIHGEVGHSGAAYWPGEQRGSSRAPDSALQGEVFVSKTW